MLLLTISPSLLTPPAPGQPDPTSILVPPIIWPNPTLKPLQTPKPLPTQVKTYTCHEASDTKQAKPGAIKIGTLICEPN